MLINPALNSPGSLLFLRERGRRRLNLGYIQAGKHQDLMLRCDDVQTGNKWNPYLALLEQGHSEGEALDLLGLKRYWWADQQGSFAKMLMVLVLVDVVWCSQLQVCLPAGIMPGKI
jgi:hypothetical protein